MAKLAIQGHRSKGDKVIKLLEMLGGVNQHNYVANHESLYFYISYETGIITYDWINCHRNTDVVIFLYTDFIKRYPHKVGDKVCFPDDLSTPFTINKMWWDSNANELLCSFVEDDIDVPVNELIAYKEQKILKNKESMERKYNIEDYLKVWSETENGLEVVVNDNFELKEKNGQFYIVKKKPQYPKTYNECCEVLFPNIIEFGKVSARGHNSILLEKLGELLVCRDVYWKIAGDWKPDWKDFSTQKYSISIDKDEIITSYKVTGSRVLVFPTAEMRDAFYENFKDLIEECKELL